VLDYPSLPSYIGLKMPSKETAYFLSLKDFEASAMRSVGSIYLYPGLPEETRISKTEVTNSIHEDEASVCVVLNILGWKEEAERLCRVRFVRRKGFVLRVSTNHLQVDLGLSKKKSRIICGRNERETGGGLLWLPAGCKLEIGERTYRGVSSIQSRRVSAHNLFY